jgi:hypothetical protein
MKFNPKITAKKRGKISNIRVENVFPLTQFIIHAPRRCARERELKNIFESKSLLHDVELFFLQGVYARLIFNSTNVKSD